MQYSSSKLYNIKTGQQTSLPSIFGQQGTSSAQPTPSAKIVPRTAPAPPPAPRPPVPPPAPVLPTSQLTGTPDYRSLGLNMGKGPAKR